MDISIKEFTVMVIPKMNILNGPFFIHELRFMTGLNLYLKIEIRIFQITNKKSFTAKRLVDESKNLTQHDDRLKDFFRGTMRFSPTAAVVVAASLLLTTTTSSSVACCQEDKVSLFCLFFLYS
jgi:hypothetical protein